MKRATMTLAIGFAMLVPIVLGTRSLAQRDKAPSAIKKYYNEELATKHLDGDAPLPFDRKRQVSLVRLLAAPEAYHGKAVQIEGFLRVGFESTAIYLSSEDAGYLITKNGLWVTIDEKPWEKQGHKPDKFDKKYVLIEGLFDKNFCGHSGAFSGSIHDIWRVQELRKLQ